MIDDNKKYIKEFGTFCRFCGDQDFSSHTNIFTDNWYIDLEFYVCGE